MPKLIMLRMGSQKNFQYDGSMPEPLAFLNGQFIPASSLSVPVYDAGFVLGATVTEQLRTIGGRLFKLDDHFARLKHSLEVVELELPISTPELAKAAEHLAGENHKLLDAGDDLGLAIFATPGDYASLADGDESGPLVAMHTFRLAFDRWAAMYDAGCRLVTTPIEQVPRECWPAELKCRSRMHYYLADLAAHKQDPQARAILLDRRGHVAETATANVLAYRRDEGLVSPPRETILPGISLMFARELSESLGIGFVERDLRIEDLLTAEEVLLTSTPNCLLPVSRVNGKPIGDARPGEMFRKLLAAWNKAVGLDIAAQAKTFARRAN
jgi:branched-subunit amino acid aminotransferase/4-amino-4-deoxychorismate lyase